MPTTLRADVRLTVIVDPPVTTHAAREPLAALYVGDEEDAARAAARPCHTPALSWASHVFTDGIRVPFSHPIHALLVGMG